MASMDALDAHTSMNEILITAPETRICNRDTRLSIQVGLTEARRPDLRIQKTDTGLNRPWTM